MSTSSDMALENAGGTRSVPVWAQVTPETVDEVCDAVRRSAGLLSVSGARYSPDAQYAQAGALHIDVSRLNRVVRLELLTLRVTVQAGIRWFDLLRFLQPHGLSVRVMPAFANFTVVPAPLTPMRSSPRPPVVVEPARAPMNSTRSASSAPARAWRAVAPARLPLSRWMFSPAMPPVSTSTKGRASSSLQTP